MRMSTFLLGGVVGASAVWILSNRNHPIVNMMKLMRQDAKSKKEQQSSTNQSQVSFSEQNRAENEKLIRSIIEHDPKLKQEFNAISKQTYTAKPDQGITASEQVQH